jgi:hypothetical protein
LKSSFDGWLVGKLVVQVDEVYEAGNWDLANKLKPLITEPTVSANIKYGPQIEVENFARFLMFSNNTSPLNIEDGDRRYFVFDSKAQPKGNDYYDALHNCVATPSSMNEIYTYLKQRDLSHFNPHRRPPMTAAKQQVIADSQHPLHTYIIEAVKSGHFRTKLSTEFTFDARQRPPGLPGLERNEPFLAAHRNPATPTISSQNILCDPWLRRTACAVVLAHFVAEGPLRFPCARLFLLV